VEKWSRDGDRVAELLFAGSSPEKAKRVLDRQAQAADPHDHPRADAGARAVAAVTKSPGRWKPGLSLYLLPGEEEPGMASSQSLFRLDAHRVSISMKSPGQTGTGAKFEYAHVGTGVTDIRNSNASQ
jgi:hypothetical protein